MREIKYRGYSKNFNMMILNDTWESASDGMVKACNQYMKEHHIDSIPVERGTFLPTKDNDMVLMQYTGLKDKNGKEIYEGDIVEINSHKYSIKFEIGSFMLVRCSDKTDMYDQFLNCWNDDVFPLSQFYWDSDDDEDALSNCEVIGNIYENPKLVQGEI